MVVIASEAWQSPRFPTEIATSSFRGRTPRDDRKRDEAYLEVWFLRYSARRVIAARALTAFSGMA